jgi:hypothetical protein
MTQQTIIKLCYEKLGGRAQLSELTGYAPNTLSNWSTGKSKMPLAAAVDLLTVVGLRLSVSE